MNSLHSCELTKIPKFHLLGISRTTSWRRLTRLGTGRGSICSSSCPSITSSDSQWWSPPFSSEARPSSSRTLSPTPSARASRTTRWACHWLLSVEDLTNYQKVSSAALVLCTTQSPYQVYCSCGRKSISRSLTDIASYQTDLWLFFVEQKGAST